MGYELKTKPTERSVIEFIEQVENVKKREDAFHLLDIFTETTSYEAKMWGPSIIGFGSYHYRYESGHEGDAAIVGFSPRKSNFSLYLVAQDPQCQALLEKLGKHKVGKACIYINKLADIDVKVLKQIIQRSVQAVSELYTISEK